MADTPLGRFCWYELLTNEPRSAPAFYAPLTGWGTSAFEGSTEPYTMWMKGEQPVGGIMRLPAEAAEAGAPPSWLGYVSTPDLDGTVDKARDLGADILDEIIVPTVGSIAVISDPQGAVFAAFQPEGDAPGHDDPPALGEFSWHELATDDPDAACAFYSELFGWTESDRMDMGEMGIYRIFGRGAHPLGGIFRRMPEMPRSFWLYYVRVPDASAAVVKVRELGGQVMKGPMEVPGGDQVAVCTDPSGAAFAVHSTAADAGAG